MNYDSAEEPSSGGGILLLVLILVIALMALPFAPAILNALIGALDSTVTWDAPLTKHAEESHAEEAWNATKVKDYFDAKGCKPSSYYCASEDTDVYYCVSPDDPAKAIGLIIGHTVRQIITGYTGPLEYWQNRCK